MNDQRLSGSRLPNDQSNMLFYSMMWPRAGRVRAPPPLTTPSIEGGPRAASNNRPVVGSF